MCVRKCPKGLYSIFHVCLFLPGPLISNSVMCVLLSLEVGGREFQLTSTKTVCDVVIDGDFVTFCSLRPISDKISQIKNIKCPKKLAAFASCGS